MQTFIFLQQYNKNRTWFFEAVGPTQSNNYIGRKKIFEKFEISSTLSIVRVRQAGWRFLWWLLTALLLSVHFVQDFHVYRLLQHINTKFYYMKMGGWNYLSYISWRNSTVLNAFGHMSQWNTEGKINLCTDGSTLLFSLNSYGYMPISFSKYMSH